MTEPSGQLPQSVYWRRRAIAIAATVVVVVLLIWGLGALLTGSNDHDRSATNAGNANWQHPAAPHGPAASSSAASAPGSAGSSTAPSSSGPRSSPAAPATSASASPSSESPSAEPSSSESAGPKACAPSLLHVTASTDRQRYSAGERPKFTMRVINVAKQPCVQDIGHAQRKLVVSAKGGKRLWGSADCSFGGTKHERRTLAPDKPVAFDVRWAGRTSEPGCPEHRSTVRSGSYRLTAKLGEVPSLPVRFAIH